MTNSRLTPPLTQIKDPRSISNICKSPVFWFKRNSKQDVFFNGYFENLPFELIVVIFTINLSLQDLKSYELVCKRFNHVIKKSQLWKTLICENQANLQNKMQQILCQIRKDWKWMVISLQENAPKKTEKKKLRSATKITSMLKPSTKKKQKQAIIVPKHMVTIDFKPNI
jgi:hypothetical protein